jgi:hypothetical protein
MSTNQHESKQRNLRSQIVTSSVEAPLRQGDVILNEVKKLSRSGRSKKGTGIRWISAPQSSLPGAPAVQGVALAGNEEVQWTWTHTVNGSYVSGYSIVRSLPKKRQRPFAALRVTTRRIGGSK